MAARTPRTLMRRSPGANGSDILDVHMTAALLTVSVDTVDDPFTKGDLPARRVVSHVQPTCRVGSGERFGADAGRPHRLAHPGN